jgi:hypothetical protein
VLIMRGSTSGDPVFERRESIKAGELPGPVYPVSLVSRQRDALKWAAGRGMKNSGPNDTGFGYEATDADAQTGNASEYLLKNAEDGRLYWVSPMTPRGDSQLFVAYMITRADEVNSGSLNHSDVYVLDDSDPRQLTLDSLDNTVRQVVISQDPGFLNNAKNPGSIVEYLPLDNTTWQVYGERGGVPVYVITIPVKNTVIKPTIATITPEGLVLKPQEVNLSQNGRQQGNQQQQPQPNQQPSPSGNADCGKAPGEMSEAELAGCLAQLANEAQRRHPN